jgi:two-component system, chemotaxis family, protein-glutamate methylesterase/glutaminase
MTAEAVGAMPELGDHRIVALVASAGGIDAVLHVLEGLPSDLRATVIVLIHQDPTHLSHLVPVLERRSQLPIAAAADGMPLSAGHVIVVPAGRHLLVTPDARVLLIPSGAYPPSRPSADLLLATLATAVGRRAVGVVLSGGGHDGATGASAVHARGGTVLATDEASSATFSMPLSAIERGAVVDRILPLNEIAGAIAELVAAPVRLEGSA